MPPIVLSVPQTGGNELMRWFDQGQGTNPINILQDFILPTQEMAAFQVRRFILLASVSPAIGQKANFVITMPDDEAWEFDAIAYTQADSVKHEVSGQWFPPGGGATFGRLQVFLLPVDTLVTTLLYPVRNLSNTAANNEDFEYTKPLRIYQDEALQIQDQTAAIGAGNSHNLRVLAHQIPLATKFQRRDELVASSLV